MKKLITAIIGLTLIGSLLLGCSLMPSTNANDDLGEANKEVVEIVDRPVVKNLSQDTRHIDRRIHVDGTDNMRDLGGYITTEGKQVKMGMVFRSDALSDITQLGAKELDGLNLDTIIDFRGQAEIKLNPNVIPHRVQYINIPITDPANMDESIPEESSQEARQAFMAGDTAKLQEIVDNNDMGDPVAKRIEKYSEFADVWTPEISKFMKAILHSEGKPVLFHCAGGKDRTGFAAATLLMTLGVSEEDVMYDYMLTNEYEKEKNDYMMSVLPEILHAYVGTRESYLNAAFDHIYDNYEDFDDYRRNALDISDEEQEALKSMLLLDAQ